MNFLSNIHSAQLILNLVFSSLIIVGVGWVLARILRRKAAPVRSGLILMILIVLMLLPILSLIPSIPNLNPFQITLPISISSSVETNIDSNFTEIEGITSETLSPYTKNKKFLPFISVQFLIRVINGFGIIWGLGFLACLIHFIYKTKSLSSFIGMLVEINDAKMTRILKSVENTFGKQIRIRIFLTNSLTTPIVMGIFRPIVVIPRNLYIQWNENTVKSILLHELSHIYHKDNLTGILQKLSTSLNWWNPLVYNLSIDFSRAREEISDNHVLLENNSRDYAECLISLAENKFLISRLAVFTPMASPYIPLNDRVRYILSKERRMETQMKKSSILLILVVSMLLLGVTTGNILIFATTTDSVPSPESIVPTSVLIQDGERKVDQERSTVDKKIVPPKLIRKVEPIYPKEAINAHIEGTVVVEATTDIHGQVQKVEVMNSVPELDQAVIDAIKKWIYEPMVINGKPRGVIFTIAFQFRLDEKARVDIKTINTDNRVPPKQLRMVDPVYPEIARQAQVEGVVILDVTIDVYGRVSWIKIVRSIPLLDQAAIRAVYQWVYEPFISVKGPLEVTFPVRCYFDLDEEKKTPIDMVKSGINGGVVVGAVGGEEGPVRVLGDIKPPKQIKKVDPIYPKEAKEAGIEGVVIVEVTTGIYGRVQNVKVLRSIPPLDQAAIDAVYQWVYEPLVLGGKPRGVIFTVTVTFKIK